MANTASTSTVVDHTTDAGFRTWVAEIIAQFAVVGLAITTDTGQINTGSATRPGTNASGGYSIFRFTDTLAKGGLATMNAIVGGSAYTNGTYTNVPLTGGTGSGGQATVTVAGGVVTAVTITTAGTGYLACDQLSAAAANIGGTGSGFTAQVATLTGAFPIVIRLEYRTGNSATAPQMAVTVGQGTNGAGTITGSNLSTNSAVCIAGGAPVSTATSYTSRFCFNPTLGFLGFAWKAGGAATDTCLGSIFIGRSNDTAGAANSDCFYVLVNTVNTTTGVTANAGAMQSCAYSTNTNYPTSQSQANNCNWNGAGTGNGTSIFPFGITSSTFSGNSYVIPVYYMAPAISITNLLCVALKTEVPVGNSFSTTIVGSTPRTYLSVGLAFGTNTNLGGHTNTGTGTMCMLWE